MHRHEISIKQQMRHIIGVSFHTHRQGYDNLGPFRRDGYTIHALNHHASTNIYNYFNLDHNSSDVLLSGI